MYGATGVGAVVGVGAGTGAEAELGAEAMKYHAMDGMVMKPVVLRGQDSCLVLPLRPDRLFSVAPFRCFLVCLVSNSLRSLLSGLKCSTVGLLALFVPLIPPCATIAVVRYSMFSLHMTARSTYW